MTPATGQESARSVCPIAKAEAKQFAVRVGLSHLPNLLRWIHRLPQGLVLICVTAVRAHCPRIGQILDVSEVADGDLRPIEVELPAHHRSADLQIMPALANAVGSGREKPCRMPCGIPSESSVCPW